MPNNSSRKVEIIHLGLQILSQATTIIAAIVVGLWGYYSTVYVKKEKEVTEYTLKEFEQRTTQKPHIQAKVESTIQPIENGLNLLQVKVTLSNLGNKESNVILDDDALTLIPVAFSEGKPIYQKPINLLSGRYAGTLSRIPLQFVNIGAGESYELTFVHSLKNPGTFLIHFLALNGITPSEKEFSFTKGIPYQYAVGADQYIVIK
ncbi:hypothetical protein [Xenorhabdus bovienii]|uniref:Uncharacterized protein n=1 Tax=Xenorhabdus bovienii str. kraussei Becker Underwood TaxID=1398204 RepID=A0A077PUM3_XENBV|nr:hypothetical protein [Xenorhabdus bovienii]CDH23554.1 conserved hypothetical protein [Xenorhabdus bovienii str. kraussei Becker Underwood]